MADPAWERGDLLGHDFPVHLEALRAAGPTFLTSAFRSTGSLGADNRVTAITQLEPFRGGSTGRKAVLSVTYEHPDPSLPEHLFVKFSRDLDDERRDRGKRQMESEVRFGLLSQIPDFPVAVPRCLFGEYHLESGSGLLISERIAFGADGIEPHHPKARDHEIDDPRGHYDALISALARLAGSHRAGRFPEEVMAPFEPRPTRRRLIVGRPPRRRTRPATGSPATPSSRPGSRSSCRHRSGPTRSSRSCCGRSRARSSTPTRSAPLRRTVPRDWSPSATGTPTSTTPGSGGTRTVTSPAVSWTGATSAR